MALSGKVGAVYVNDINTAPIPFTDEATTADSVFKRYQISNEAYRYWLLDADITVKKNGEVITDGYKIERAGGFVVFDTALADTDIVTVSGQALTLVQCGGFFNWSIDAKADTADITTYASNGWKENLQTVNGWSGKAEAYWGDKRFFDSLGQVIVVKLFIDRGASQKCLEGFAEITTDSIETAIDDIVKESIEFEGVGPLYPRF